MMPQERLTSEFPSYCASARRDSPPGPSSDRGGKGKAKAGPPGANHPERLQVLIITGQNPHDWRGTTASLRKTLEETEKFEVREKSMNFAVGRRRCWLPMA